MKNMVTLKDMKFLKNLINFITLQTFLKLLAFLIIIWTIWARFIRERLPRDIPFNLNMWSLVLLLYICILYIYIIYRTIKPKSPGKLQLLLMPFLRQMFTPFISLNDHILAYKPTQKFIRYLILFLFQLKAISKNVRYNQHLFIYNFLFTVPRVIFLICFLLDCFYFHQLSLIYTCVIVITIPLFTRYICYCVPILNKMDLPMLEEYFLIEITSEDIVYKEDDYDEEGFLKYGIPRHYEDPSLIPYDGEHDYKYLNVSKFIDYQSSAITDSDILYEYKILFKEKRKDMLYLGSPIEHPITKQECEKLLQFMVKSTIIPDEIPAIYEYNPKMVKNITIITSMISLICWSYILYKSIHTLPDNSFLWLKYLLPDYDNPFY